MQLGGEIRADEAHVPRFRAITGELLFARRVAQRKAKVVRVRGEPLDGRAGRQSQVGHGT
jgi:hypothetical protein